MVGQLKEENNNNNTSDISSDKWVEYFKNLHQEKTVASPKLEAQILEQLRCLPDNDSDILNQEISTLEIIKATKKIKNNKSCGEDSIQGEMIKYSVQHIQFVIQKMFNLIFTTKCYPKLWCLGHIVPIYKAGDNSEPSNYRGITVSSAMGKLFNIILNERLTTFLEKHEIIDHCQIGFRKSCRTSDHLFV